MLEPTALDSVQHYMDMPYLYRTLLALCLWLGACTCCVSQESYFPPKAFGNGQWADSEASLYSFILRKLEEPPLFTKAQKPSVEAYRFLWLRTFHNPVAVLMEVQADNSSILTIKVADGHAGFPRTVTKLIQNTTRALSRQQTDEFRRKVQTQGFWNVVTRDNGGPAATDCDGWILEGVEKGNYHVVARAIPNRLPETSKTVRTLAARGASSVFPARRATLPGARSHEALGSGRGDSASAKPLLIYPTREE